MGQDGGDALGGERAKRDGPGGDGFRPGGVEAAVEPPHTQAGAKTLLGMGAAGEHRHDQPLRVGPDRASPAPEALRRPLGIAPVRARHVIRIGAVPASAEAALMSRDPLAAMEHLDGAAGQAHVDLRADQRVRHRVEEALGLDMIVEAEGFLYSVPHALIRAQLSTYAPHQPHSRGVPSRPAGRGSSAPLRRTPARHPIRSQDAAARTGAMPSGRRSASGAGLATIGPRTEGLIIAVLRRRPHPEQGFGPAWVCAALPGAGPRPGGSRLGQSRGGRSADLQGHRVDPRPQPHQRAPRSSVERARGSTITNCAARATSTDGDHLCSTHPTLDLLHALGLRGMAQGFKALDANPEARALGHADGSDCSSITRPRSAAEALRGPRPRRAAAPSRQHRGRRLPQPSRPRPCAVPEARHPRLDPDPAQPGDHRALRRGQKLAGLRARAQGLPGRPLGPVLPGAAPVCGARLARGDGRYGRLLRQIARVNLLILDDWGPEPLLPEQARDLLEIVEDRYDAGSPLITSQVPVDRWYDIIGIPTLADAVLDRRGAQRLSDRTLRREPA